MTMHAYAGLGAPTKAPEPAAEEPSTLATLVSYVAKIGGGYLVGRALAPSKADALTYGLIGAAVGGASGPFGLGVFGIVSLKQRGE